jgi:glycosyltransferase involved in cell wall biosynthesis
MLEALQRWYGRLPNATVISNGRRPPRVNEGEKQPCILSAGRLWDQAKNLSALISVAGQLEWPVLLAGETKNPGAADAASTPWRSSNCRLLGALPASELAAWMAQASVFALPVRYEPFGLSILEAAQAGCALVVGDIDSQRELWEGAAAFVHPDDTRQLAAVLRMLISRPDERAALAQAARERARRFSPQAMADAYLELYRQVRRVPPVRATFEDQPCAL